MKEEEIIDGAMYRMHSTSEQVLNTWCKHNLLIARVYDDGSIRFKDTYWMSGEWIYSFANVRDRISFVFDMNHGRVVTNREWQDYSNEDKTWIPIGGINEQWIVDDRAEKSPEMVRHTLELEIIRIEEEIEAKKQSLEWKKEMFAKLLQDDQQ